MRRKLAFQKILLPAVGSFFAIFLCMELLLISGQMLVIPPFGATCVIAFVIPDSIFAHPRNIIGGYLVSCIVGLLILAIFGMTPLSYALSVALAIAIMQISKTLHPPAAALPMIIVVQNNILCGNLILTVFVGSLVITLWAIIYNNYLAKPKHSVYYSVKLPWQQHNKKQSMVNEI